MSYTIQQVANMTGIPATTLRYYDKEGLLPFLERRSSGYREFSDIDLASLQIVQCLKATGMSVAEMKQFSDWVRGGDATLKERLDMFLRRQEAVERQIEELQRSLAAINYQCDTYSPPLNAGTEQKMPANHNPHQ